MSIENSCRCGCTLITTPCIHSIDQNAGGTATTVAIGSTDLEEPLTIFKLGSSIYYRRQGPDHKLVSSDNALVGAQETVWTQVSTGIHTLVQDRGEPTQLRTARLRLKPGAAGLAAPDDSGLLVWQTYWVNGRFTLSDAWAKLYGALDRLTGHGDDSAVVIFHTREEPANAGAAQALLTSFAQANLATIGTRLAAVRSGEGPR